MKRRITIAIVALAVFIFTTMGLYPLLKRERFRNRIPKLHGHERLLAIADLGEFLKPNMRKIEVSRLLGPPDNQYDENVWMWILNASKDTNESSWVQRFSEEGFFVIFKNDLLLSPLLKNSETTPWDYYKHKAKISQAESEVALGGKKPTVVRP